MLNDAEKLKMKSLNLKTFNHSQSACLRKQNIIEGVVHNYFGENIKKPQKKFR